MNNKEELLQQLVVPAEQLEYTNQQTRILLRKVKLGSEMFVCSYEKSDYHAAIPCFFSVGGAVEESKCSIICTKIDLFNKAEAATNLFSGTVLKKVVGGYKH